jgi:hypothetical protein
MYVFRTSEEYIEQTALRKRIDIYAVLSEGPLRPFPVGGENGSFFRTDPYGGSGRVDYFKSETSGNWGFRQFVP